MSKQPLFDVKALREIDSKPGDVFTLELPQDDYEVLTPELKQRLRRELSQQMNGASVLLLKPGMRLEKLPNGLRLTNTTDAPQPITVQWHGNMPSVVRVEEPAPSLMSKVKEAVESACPGVPVSIRDASEPCEMPHMSLKEANEQHATETAEAVTLIAKPSMRYLRPLSTGVLQGSNDRETWVDLDPTTMEPVQPQADEPVVIERKDGA